jgi:hypothetical protein
MDMKRYEVTLTGARDLLMHKDNIQFGEKIKMWCKDPKNKKDSVSGDDRSPAFTWIGYCYEDGKNIVLDSDNLMTMLREGGAKCPTGKKQETFKKITQSGLLVDDIGWTLLVDGAPISWAAIKSLEAEEDFSKHEALAKSLGFELFVKRAKIGFSKHVRVRPRFVSNDKSNWSATGTISVLNSQITEEVLQNILTYAGALCGICDWRPSSPKAPGPFGTFTASIKQIG